MEDHSYYVAEEKARECESSTSKKRKHEAKLNRDRQRQKTRINIGVAFPQWKSLMRHKCFQSDSEVACFLLECYERGLATSTPIEEKPFQVTAPAVFSIGASSGTDSLHDMSSVEEDTKENVFKDALNNVMGGALKREPSFDQLPVTGIAETVHDQPAHEDPPDEPCDQAALLPGPQIVLSEEDIVGARASIVYEDCLRQLASLMILPVKKCTVLLKTGEACDCVAPFEINVTPKGTAMSVEWICPNGHSLWKWNSQPVMKYGMQAGDFLLSTNILLSGNNYTKVALLFKCMNMGMVNKGTFFSIQDTYCVDTVKDFCEERRTEAHSRLQWKDVVVPGSGRNDSPGHASKRHAFSHPVYEARNLLAALDYNFHRNRPAMKTAEGKDIFRRLNKKNARRYSLCALKSEKTYEYISELQARILKRRIASGVGMPRRRSLRADDPRGLGLVPPIPAPATSEVVQT